MNVYVLFLLNIEHSTIISGLLLLTQQRTTGTMLLTYRLISDNIDG